MLTHATNFHAVLARPAQFWQDAFKSYRLLDQLDSSEATMAGFCRNCGSPLDDAQAFCAKCGTATSGPPVRSAAPPPVAPPSTPPSPRPQAPAQAAPQAYAAAPAAVAPSKSGSTLLKVLLAFVIVIFLLGAVGIAGIWYVGHRIKQKVHDMGLDEVSNTSQGPILPGVDACNLLSKEDVGQVVKLTVVRAEHVEGGDPGCQYSVMGNYPDMIASHLSKMQQDLAAKDNQNLTDAQKEQMDTLTKSFFHSMNNPQENPSQHPGESPVFIFSVSNSGAKAQMSMTRMAFGRMVPAFTELPGIGDEAFDIGEAMILARKGDKVVRVMYMMCPCTRADAVPLVKRIVDNM